ncbi:MAG: septal ring lytic transglycosylase RlpA family protein [Pseudomonadota bacterium]
MSGKSFVFGVIAGAAGLAGVQWYFAQPVDFLASSASPVPQSPSLKPTRDALPPEMARVRVAPEQPRRVQRQTVPSAKVIGRFSGQASYYSASLNGRTTASGEPYQHAGYTAAHRTLPFGTKLLVTRRDTRDVVYVTVNDRGPFVDNRVIDLSGGAAEALGMISAGIVTVDVEVLAD